MEVVGYIASVFIGISLGMIGGGGSVLTIPILVYFFHIEPILASAYSLFIVGITSTAGVFQKWNKGEINFRVAIIFGLPSLLTVYLLRKFFIPYIPDVIFHNNWVTIYKGSLMLVLFSVLMISAAIGILKPRGINRPALPEIQGLILLGVFVGIISGLLGAGGGFIIIPALIFYASLNVKTAVGTSLVIISLNSLVGFSGDLQHHTIIWPDLITITTLAIIGIFIGHWLSGKLPEYGIKKIFGWFILLTGICILGKELLF